MQLLQDCQTLVVRMLDGIRTAINFDQGFHIRIMVNGAVIEYDDAVLPWKGV